MIFSIFSILEPILYTSETGVKQSIRNTSSGYGDMTLALYASILSLHSIRQLVFEFTIDYVFKRSILVVFDQ